MGRGSGKQPDLVAEPVKPKNTIKLLQIRVGKITNTRVTFNYSKICLNQKTKNRSFVKERNGLKSVPDNLIALGKRRKISRHNLKRKLQIRKKNLHFFQ